MSRSSSHAWDGTGGGGRRRPRSIALGLVAVALAGGVALGGVAGAAAQATPEAGPMASPAAGPCQPLDAAMAASPAAGMAEGTPEAVGTPVTDQATIDAAVAAAENLANCWNAGDLAALLTLVTPNFVETTFGAGGVEGAVSAMQGLAELPQYAIVSTGNVQTYADGRVSLDIEYMLGQYQFVNARWYMVMAGDALVIDEQELLVPQPEGDSAVVSFTFAADGGDLAFDQDVDAETGVRLGTVQPVIILHGDNDDTTQARVAILVRVPDAMAGTPVSGDALPADTEFVAIISVAADDEADVALIGPPVGSYVLFEPGGVSAPMDLAEPEA